MTALQHIALVVGEDRASGPRFTFEESEIKIGRGAAMDLQFETSTISTQHARILLHDDGVYYLEDMRSTNGTFLNGHPITEPQPLSSGDRIGLGKTIILFFEALAGPAPADGTTEIQVGMTMMDGAEPVTSPPPASPRLEVYIGGEYSSRFSLTEPSMTLGRAPDNDIVINSGIISRYLARLEFDGTVYQIVPLPDVSNPLLFEGQPLAGPLQLYDNLRLQIGGQNPATVVHLTYLAAWHPNQTLDKPLPSASINVVIDEQSRQQQVEQITGSTFFRVLKNKARSMRDDMQE